MDEELSEELWKVWKVNLKHLEEIGMRSVFELGKVKVIDIHITYDTFGRD